jgi:hypothetical protein
LIITGPSRTKLALFEKVIRGRYLEPEPSRLLANENVKLGFALGGFHRQSSSSGSRDATGENRECSGALFVDRADRFVQFSLNY